MANLSINAAAKSAGVSGASVRNWLKSEPSLKKHTRKGKRGIELTEGGVDELRKIAERRRKAASPALQKAWAAKKAGTRSASAKKAGKTRRKRKAAKKAVVTRKRRSAARKAAATKRARRSQGAAPGVDAALAQLAAQVGQAVESGTAELKKQLRQVLLRQRELIDQALKMLD